ncbi:MAG: ABC transporter ATP-binding protein [Clostridium sp.]|nr:ABC transporter ATP-binding protein [Clostridium sp.]
MGAKMITVKNLSKAYGDYAAVNNVTLKITRKDFVGIIGESGSGKSTLLYLLSGLLNATSGSILFEDTELTKASDKVLSHIRSNCLGFVFQFHNLIPGLTVLENMELPLILTNQNPAKHHKKIFGLLEQVGLSDYAKRSVEELSGGQQQRVSIARALVNDPKVIFADEPTGNLDSENTDHVIDLFGVLNKEHKVSIIMVTHSERTLRYCNKVIRISDGRILT